MVMVMVRRLVFVTVLKETLHFVVKFLRFLIEFLIQWHTFELFVFIEVHLVEVHRTKSVVTLMKKTTRHEWHSKV